MRLSVSAVLRYAFFAGAVAFFALLPQWISTFKASQFVLVGIYFIALIGLNIVTGYNGQISLGHGAFMGVGAYTTMILVTKTSLSAEATIPLAGLVAGLVGFIFGFPALRLSGVYLALATFGMAVSFIAVVQTSHLEDLTGGATGLFVGIPQTPYYLTWGIALGMFLAAWLLLRGRLGRRFRAVRDAPIAAVSSGVNLALVKTTAFGISAAYAGVAGSLLAIYLGFVNPLTFPVALSITLLVGAALGGFGSLTGMIFGALFIEFAPLQAEGISKEAPAVMYGLILLAILFLMPGGAAELLRRIVLLLKRLTRGRYSRPKSEGGEIAT